MPHNVERGGLFGGIATHKLPAMHIPFGSASPRLGVRNISLAPTGRYCIAEGNALAYVGRGNYPRRVPRHHALCKKIPPRAACTRGRLAWLD